LIRADGKLAGFALVEERQIIEPGAPRYTMADFFVLKIYRRQGIGQQAAWDLFRRFTGSWLIQEHGANSVAQAFWRTAVGRYTRDTYEEKRYGIPERLFLVAQRFDSATGR
ncbi:MAG TPA: GNAT family N-acetyltransferase, partial [Chloroflexota bacterium]